eukprot:1727551-Prymnesium_polylepis.1
MGEVPLVGCSLWTWPVALAPSQSFLRRAIACVPCVRVCVSATGGGKRTGRKSVTRGRQFTIVCVGGGVSLGWRRCMWMWDGSGRDGMGTGWNGVG